MRRNLGRSVGLDGAVPGRARGPETPQIRLLLRRHLSQARPRTSACAHAIAGIRNGSAFQLLPSRLHLRHLPSMVLMHHLRGERWGPYNGTCSRETARIVRGGRWVDQQLVEYPGKFSTQSSRFKPHFACTVPNGTFPISGRLLRSGLPTSAVHRKLAFRRGPSAGWLHGDSVDSQVALLLGHRLRRHLRHPALVPRSIPVAALASERAAHREYHLVMCRRRHHHLLVGQATVCRSQDTRRHDDGLCGPMQRAVLRQFQRRPVCLRQWSLQSQGCRLFFAASMSAGKYGLV